MKDVLSRTADRAAARRVFFIDGDKIYLRNVALEDVNENYYRWMNDPEVNRYMETRFTPQTMESIREYVKTMSDRKDMIFLAMCLKGNGQHVGNIKLGPINYFHRFAVISLFIGEKGCWGKGIASSAIGLITKFAFEKLNLHKVMAGCYDKNIGSARAFEKAGFQREGLFKSKWFCDGKYIDEILLYKINPREAAQRRDG